MVPKREISEMTLIYGESAIIFKYKTANIFMTNF